MDIFHPKWNTCKGALDCGKGGQACGMRQGHGGMHCFRSELFIGSCLSFHVWASPFLFLFSPVSLPFLRSHFPFPLSPFPFPLSPWPLPLSPCYPYPNNAFQKQVLLQDAAMGEKLLVYDEVQVECTAPWLEAPHALILPHNGRNFEVQVTLPEYHLSFGRLHIASMMFMVQ